jgi:hypothetical protein
LEYLEIRFAGSSGKTRDERFLLQDAGGAFLKTGYSAAVRAKKERESKVLLLILLFLLWRVGLPLSQSIFVLFLLLPLLLLHLLPLAGEGG